MNFDEYITHINSFKNNELSDWYLGSAKLTDKQSENLINTFINQQFITSINLRGRNIGPAIAIIIAEMIKYNSFITSIDLSSNCIGTKGAITLAELIKNNSSLTSIDLSSNDIELKGAIAFTKAIKNHPYLISIDLRGNNIRAEEAEALAKAIEGNFIITNIQVSGYKQIYIEIEKVLSRNKKMVEKLAEFLIKIGIEEVEIQNEQDALHCTSTNYPPEIKSTTKSFGEIKVEFKDYFAFNFYQRCDQVLLRSIILGLLKNIDVICTQNDVTKLLKSIDNYIALHWIELSGLHSCHPATNKGTIISQKDKETPILDLNNTEQLSVLPLNLLPDDTLFLIGEYLPKTFLFQTINGAVSALYVEE